MSENITIHEIGYISDGLNHVLKLPGEVDMGMTKEYAETHPKDRNTSEGTPRCHNGEGARLDPEEL